MRTSVKILNAAPDEDKDGRIMIRGRLSLDSLKLIKVPKFQRKVLPLASINKLIKAHLAGGVPDIYLAMEGQSYKVRDGDHFLDGDVWVIDGLQRLSAAIRMMEQNLGEPHVGAAIYFDYEEDWGRQKFQDLNVLRNKLSPNVIARNLAEDWTVIRGLLAYTEDKESPLYQRVTWDQRAERTHVMTALGLIKAAAYLHSHLGAVKSGRIDEFVENLQGITDGLGRNVFRDNVNTFFNLLDELWGIRRIAYKEGACYLRTTFLLVLADVFSSHENFWREKRLFLDVDLKRKLGLFPIDDPEVIRLASAGGQAKELLEMLMLRHLNKGRKVHRLVRRRSDRRATGPAVQEEAWA